VSTAKIVPSADSFYQTGRQRWPHLADCRERRSARGVIVTQVLPNERRIASPLIKEAQELAKAKGLEDISPAMMEGDAAAKVLVEGLRRAGPKPTPNGLRSALEGISNFDIGGLTVSYSATNHTGLEFADLSIIDDQGRFRR
jgi:branched-chain amino acid transport system substrate-binding protein